MALEYSEVMAAGAMLCSEADLKTASNSSKELGDWITKTKKIVENKVEFGSSRTEFISFIEPTPAAMREATIGISAALAIKGWLKSEHGQRSDPIAENVFHLKRELGDICWYIAQACMALDTNFEEVLQMNFEKLSARYPEGTFDVFRSENRVKGDL